MAQQAKVSVNIKPRLTDQYLGTGMVYVAVLLDWVTEVGMVHGQKAGVVLPPNMVVAARRQELIYNSTLLISEEAKVSTRITRIGRSSMTSETQISEARSGRPIATIITEGVLMDTQTRRSVSWPDEVKQKNIAFEGKENIEVVG